MHLFVSFFVTDFVRKTLSTIKSVNQFLHISLYSKSRVLPRNQIHRDEWPTEFEKGGPFKKLWGHSELSVYDANGLSTFRQVEKT